MKKFIVIIGCLVFIVSCQKNEISDRIENNKIEDKIEVQNGILSFSSKDLLSRTMENLKQINDKEKEDKLSLFYDKGFMPLYPHFKENDVGKLLSFSAKKLEKLENILLLNPQARSASAAISGEENFVGEFDDDLISDDEFASILNDNREIIIGDTLYRYTYSGVFSVHKDEKQLLDNYIKDNNIEYDIPDLTSLTRGSIKITAQITKEIPTTQRILQNDCNGSSSPTNELSLYFDDCNNGGGGGSGGSSPNPPIDHTQGLVNLLAGLEVCETINGFLNNGFGLLGVTEKCFSNFDSSHRTKTKYWKENYLVWNSMGVKVKHQKKGWTGLWRAQSTDEVALSISQATFKYKINIPNFPQSYAPQKLYFFENKVFNSQSQIINYQNEYQKPPFPSIPLVSEVIVTEFISDIPGNDLSVDKMRELFYQGVWGGAKQIVQQYKNRQPKNITHIIYTPTVVYLNYVDLERRVLNTKKIVNQLDYNFGLGFKFNVNVDAQGNYSTNISNVGDVLGNIIIPHLYDYNDVKMDFVGASRRGNTWKGSRIVYTD